MEYISKALRRGQYGGVDVVGYREAEESSVLAGQVLTCFIDNFPTEEAARAAHPEVSDNWHSTWTAPQVSLNHLPSEDDFVPGGAYPDDVDDGDDY